MKQIEKLDPYNPERKKIHELVEAVNALAERMEKIAFHASVELDRLAQVEPDKHSEDYRRGFREAIQILQMEEPE